MTTAQCRKQASLILKNRYGEGFFVVMVCVSAFIILKILDIAQTGLLLYSSNMDTSALFQSGIWWQVVMKVMSSLLFLFVMTPLATGGIWWFYQTASGSDNKSILKLYTSFRLNVRAMGLYFIMWLLNLLSLLPSGACFYFAFYVYGLVPVSEDQALVLFLAFQIFMAGVFLLGFYLRCVSKLFLAPFLFIAHPDMNIIKIIRLSGRKIYGSKLECIKLIMTYVPAMLPVVTVPFVLPKAIMSFSVFARDRINSTGGQNCEK